MKYIIIQNILNKQDIKKNINKKIYNIIRLNNE